MRVGDYILLASAGVGDFLTEVRNIGEIMPWVMEMRYGFVPSNYKKTNYLSAVSRLISTGDIERKTDKNGKTFLELTSTGGRKFKRRFPIFSTMRSKWDGCFMEVIFDISERDRTVRNTLRNKLIELGFGMLQESVWISPYHFEEDLREFLEAHKLGDRVFVLEARKLLAGDMEELIEKIWHLERIKKMYEEVESWEDYLIVLKNDPMIPENLYPMQKTRNTAYDLICGRI